MGWSDFWTGYAAIVATGVLIWDIVKWKRTGPRIHLSLTFPQRGVSRFLQLGEDARASRQLTISNRGDRATTVQSIVSEWYGTTPWFRTKRLHSITHGTMVEFDRPRMLNPGVAIEVNLRRVNMTQALSGKARWACVAVKYSDRTRPARLWWKVKPAGLGNDVEDVPDA